MPDDIGSVIRVEVTAAKPPTHTPASVASAPTTAVVAGTITNSVLPTVTGTAVLGQVLTGNTGTWAPGDVVLARQWLRDGTPIVGATGGTYTTVVDDVGKAISLRVTATKPGYDELIRTSTASADVVGTITADKPKITGKLKVGKTLTAKPGTSTPSAVTVKYQWLRNGNAIRGATAAKYKLTKKDKGKKISVKVTRTAEGWKTLVLKSAQTGAIKG